MTMSRLTNKEFAARVGVTVSYASYLKSGSRSPSADVLIRIIRAFKLEPDEVAVAMDRFQEGPDAFGRFLRETLFAEKSTEDEPAAEPANGTR